MEGFEAVVFRKERSEAVETLSCAPQVVESEQYERFPASSRVGAIPSRVSETGTTGKNVRYAKILRRVQLIGHGVKYMVAPTGWVGS